MEVPRVHAGFLFFVLSSFLFIHIFRQLLVLRDVLEINVPTHKEAVQLLERSPETWTSADFEWAPPKEEIELLRNHPWPLNPFAQSEKAIRYIADSLPFAALVGLWCLGAQSGTLLMRKQKEISDALAVSAFFAYAGFGICIVVQIALIWKFCSDKKLARVKNGGGFFYHLDMVRIEFFDPCALSRQVHLSKRRSA